LGKRLKPVFSIDVEICNEYGGAVKIIASIEDPAGIQVILSYLKRQDSGQHSNSIKLFLSFQKKTRY